MTESIQRAARAICINNDEDPDTPDTPYEIRGWRLYKSDATACIETLLDPSEEAVEAASRAICRSWLKPRADQEPEFTNQRWPLFKNEALNGIRAYHMKVLGR